MAIRTSPSATAQRPRRRHLRRLSGPESGARRGSRRCAGRGSGERRARPAAAVRVVVEADRRAGQLDGAERRVVDVDQQALRAGLLPVVDVVEGAHLAGRHPRLRQPLEPVLGRLVREQSLDHLDQLVAVGDAFGVGREARLGRVEPELRREGPPQPLRTARDLDRGGAGGEHPVRRDRRVVVTGQPRNLPGDRPAGALERVHADHSGQQRRAYDAADAGAGALVQRGHHAVRPVHAGQQVRDRHPDLGRQLGAGDRHQPALALRDLVVPGARRLRAVVPEAGDRQHHQSRG